MTLLNFTTYSKTILAKQQLPLVLKRFTGGKIIPQIYKKLSLIMISSSFQRMILALNRVHTPSTLFAINLFATVHEHDLNSNLPITIAIKQVHALLFQCLINKMRFSDILKMMHSKGIKCTPDDLIVWGKTFVDTNYIDKTFLNNDLGYCELSTTTAYPNERNLHLNNPDSIHSYYPNTPMPYQAAMDQYNTTGEQAHPNNQEDASSYSSSSPDYSSDSDMSITWDFSELYALFGFMGTLIFSVTFAVVIEYMKDKWDTKNSSDQDKNKGTSNTLEEQNTTEDESTN